MDIQDLRIFDRVAAVQNLSAVGNEFALTPGTISKRLRSLEDELGARLFTRSTRSIKITEEGRIFLEHAQRMLGEFDAAKASVDGNRGSPRGLIKMSAPVKLGNRDLAVGLNTFMAEYPEINVLAEVCDRTNGTAEEGFDITIKTGALADSSLIAKRLADNPMVVVASPAYLKLRGTPTSPQDLERHSCLVHGDNCHWTFRRSSSERSVRVSGRLRSNDIGLLHSAARNGHGLVRLSEAQVEEDVKAGYLVPVLSDFDTSGDSAIWAIFPKSKNMLPRMRVLLDFMADWLKEPASGKQEAVRAALQNGKPPKTVLKKRSGVAKSRAVGLPDEGKSANTRRNKPARQGRPRSGATA